jgi:hypothetical protein
LKICTFVKSIVEIVDIYYRHNINGLKIFRLLSNWNPFYHLVSNQFSLPLHLWIYLQVHVNKIAFQKLFILFQKSIIYILLRSQNICVHENLNFSRKISWETSRNKINNWMTPKIKSKFHRHGISCSNKIVAAWDIHESWNK